MESDGSLNINNLYFYLNGERIAYGPVFGDDGLYFYYNDHLGNVRMITSEYGDTCYDADYFPWGGVIQAFQNSCPTQYFQFAGKERDPIMDIDYFEARFFQDVMGRFYSPDLLGGHIEDPQTLNKYTYVRDNPVSLSDATGLDFYLSCQSASSTCAADAGGNLVQGQYTADKNGNMTFQPTVVTSASLQDPNSGNSATVNQNGVQITTPNGTSEGIFINGTPAANDIRGSGQLAGLSFNVNYSDERGGNLAGGTFSFNGSAADARSLLAERGAFNYGLRDEFDGSMFGFHPGTGQFRFGTGPSSHLSVPDDWVLKGAAGMEGELTFVFVQNPELTTPVSGGFHVDAHVGGGHARDVICGITGLGCQ